MADAGQPRALAAVAGRRLGVVLRASRPDDFGEDRWARLGFGDTPPRRGTIRSGTSGPLGCPPAHLGRSLPGGDGPDAFIFTTPTGEPVRHNLFYKRVFSPAVREAFPGRSLRFHDLRHTCAAWLIEAGAHPLQIKLRLGHKEIRTTMDTYGHLFPSAEPELADLLDAGYRTADAPAVVALA